MTSITFLFQILGSKAYPKAPVAFGTSRNHALKTDTYIRTCRDDYMSIENDEAVKKQFKKQFGVSIPCAFHLYPHFDLYLDVVLCIMHWSANIFKLGLDLLTGKKLAKSKTMQETVQVLISTK